MVDIVSPNGAMAPKFFALTEQNASFCIRPQTRSDDEWVENLHARVFGPGRFARTAFRIREVLPLDKNLCLIGEYKNPNTGDLQRAGSVWMTPVSLSGLRGCLLGPLAINPEFRQQGLGKKLVVSVTDMALKNGTLETGGYEFVVLVGDATYYNSMGFVGVEKGAIKFPGPVDYKRILVCPKKGEHINSLSGTIL